jgi:tRNA (adenine22-N1)-methyltransferase
VIASDLREGPLASAKANIEAHGCSESIHTVLTNGLDGLDGYGITDAVICGMGGDTMMDILSRASFLKKKGTRLILQPQSAYAELMIYLSTEGFRIYAERYAEDHKKPYRVIGVVYDGIGEELSLARALVGSPTFSEDNAAYVAFCRKILNTVEKKIFGAKQRGSDTASLESLRDDILVQMNL